MSTDWFASSFVLAVVVFAHATYWQKSHGPVRSFWLKRDRRPLRCAVYAFIGGPFGAAEYLMLCVTSRAPRSTLPAQGMIVGADKPPEDIAATQEYWDRKFREALEKDSA